MQRFARAGGCGALLFVAIDTLPPPSLQLRELRQNLRASIIVQVAASNA